jgi:hypothetical protein
MHALAQAEGSLVSGGSPGEQYRAEIEQRAAERDTKECYTWVHFQLNIL